jgi:hypothetical protein
MAFCTKQTKFFVSRTSSYPHTPSLCSTDQHLRSWRMQKLEVEADEERVTNKLHGVVLVLDSRLDSRLQCLWKFPKVCAFELG